MTAPLLVTITEEVTQVITVESPSGDELLVTFVEEQLAVTFSPTGERGERGPGVAPGGVTGELPFKASSTDFDIEWRRAQMSDVEGLEAAIEAAATDADLANQAAQQAATDAAQSAAIAAEVEDRVTAIEAVLDDIDDLLGDLGTIDDRLTQAETDINDLTAALAQEETDRADADTAEAAARIAADNTESAARIAALATEAGQRATADALLIPLTQKGAADGVATLDSGSKIPTSQLPAAILGNVSYQGTWNAATNSPTIPSAASGNKGWYYRVSVAGATNVDGITDWRVGDWIISNGTEWEKVDNTDQVTSVFGRQGAVVAAAGDYAIADITGLQTALDDETDAREAGDAASAALVSAEASLRASADTAEAATRLAADAGESATRAAADTTNANAIAGEITTRAAADVILQSNIDAEVAARAAADSSEASTRASADTTLQTNITAEASTRASADTTLQTNITSEASTRAAADTALAGVDETLDARVVALETAAPPSGISAGSWIKSGATVAWTSSFTFRIGAATYYIDGILYSSLEQTVSLTAADATNPRTDVITLDAAGALSKITGTPSSTPAVPAVDLSLYVVVTTVDVPAAASAAAVTETTIWKEDAGAEWNGSVFDASIVVASTSNPRTGTKCIEATAAAAGDYVEFTIDASFLDLLSQDKLVFYIRHKALWPTKKVLQISWRAGAVVKGGVVTVAHGDYGLDTQTIGVYQQIVIPISAFSVPAGSQITKLRIAISGTGATIGWYIDDIITQAGASAAAAFQQFRWRGEWVSTAAYVLNDAVRRNNLVYLSLGDNTNKDPEANLTLWERLVTPGRGFGADFGDAVTAPSAGSIVSGRVAFKGKISSIYVDSTDGSTFTATLDIKKNGTTILPSPISISAASSYGPDTTLTSVTRTHAKGDKFTFHLTAFSGTAKGISATVLSDEGVV